MTYSFVLGGNETPLGPREKSRAQDENAPSADDGKVVLYKSSGRDKDDLTVDLKQLFWLRDIKPLISA